MSDVPYPIHGSATIATPTLIYLVVDDATFDKIHGDAQEAPSLYWKSMRFAEITIVFQNAKPPKRHYIPCQHCRAMIEIAALEMCPQCGSFHTDAQIERQLHAMLEMELA